MVDGLKVEQPVLSGEKADSGFFTRAVSACESNGGIQTAAVFPEGLRIEILVNYKFIIAHKSPMTEYRVMERVQAVHSSSSCSLSLNILRC
jgi:hypothetical protein